MHPIQETGKRPTAALDRNLAYLGLVEILFGYPLDGVVLTTGCDKTTPACLMRAATVNMPAIVLVGRPDAERLAQGQRTGSAPWSGKRARTCAGEIDYEEFMNIVGLVGAIGRSLQHHGHRLHHEFAGRGLGHVAAGMCGDPRPYRERGQIAYETGTRIVGMVWED